MIKNLTQSNLGALNLPGLPNIDKATSSQSFGAFDRLIRSSRIMNIIAESSSDDSTCQQRAEWERNISRVRAFQYNCTVQGHVKADGKPWELNKIVRIDDDFCDVHRPLLLNGIEWTFDDTSGSKTNLNFVDEKAYSTELLDPSRFGESVDALTDIPLGIDISIPGFGS